FRQVDFNWPGGKHLTIKVENYSASCRYIQSAILNGKPLNENWISQQELMKGGKLIIMASEKPNKSWGRENQWVSAIDK
ncbi:MAG TPA: glycoside hydrolase domain-containing protein, partial [Mucilaginibacter sp.]|nr:glycoside hydrolase domain-containing protein [Mucilaginibacter sp.]